MKLVLHTFQLPLRHTFTITHESRDVQPTLVVELQHAGHSGYGEATETPYYGIRLGGLVAELKAVQPQVEAFRFGTPEALYEQMAGLSAFARCALDVAAHDLFGKLNGQPLYRLWGLDPAHNPLTDYTIGMASPEKMIEKMQEMPFPLYKIKLTGTANDPGLVRRLRRHTDAVFRVDANTGWTAQQTLAYAPILKDLGVEFIEQPLKPADTEGMKQVFEGSVLPIMADESCQTEADVAACQGLFHGVNIKLMKCGGLTPARRMIADARRRGLKAMVGCMTESNIGCSAIAQLLPLLDYVDMDGILLVDDQISSGVTIHYGTVHYAAENGTGARLLAANPV